MGLLVSLCHSPGPTLIFSICYGDLSEGRSSPSQHHWNSLTSSNSSMFLQSQTFLLTSGLMQVLFPLFACFSPYTLPGHLFSYIYIYISVLVSLTCLKDPLLNEDSYDHVPWSPASYLAHSRSSTSVCQRVNAASAIYKLSGYHVACAATAGFRH